MPHHTSDTRILGYEPLLAPAALLQELPLGQARATTIEQGRADVRAVLDMADDRLLVVVAGPCSVHDPVAAMDYAHQLAELRRSHQDDLLPAPPPAAATPRISPEYVRISMASAIALRMRSGRFSRDFDFGGINLLLNYDEGCLSDCGYCGLARTRPGSYQDKSFIRVEWPLVRTDELVDRMARHEAALTRLCISMVTHGHAYADTCDITRRIAQRVRTPLSILVAPPTLNRERLETFKSLGVDMIGIGLDAVTEELFRNIRTNVPAGGRSGRSTGRS